jgi:hypothetical protein
LKCRCDFPGLRSNPLPWVLSPQSEYFIGKMNETVIRLSTLASGKVHPICRIGEHCGPWDDIGGVDHTAERCDIGPREFRNLPRSCDQIHHGSLSRVICWSLKMILPGRQARRRSWRRGKSIGSVRRVAGNGRSYPISKMEYCSVHLWECT